MDATRFDALSRRLGQVASRRTLLGGLLGSLLGVAAVAPTASRRRSKRRFGADGPCGNGGPKANRCDRNRDCCTRVCDRKAGRCRCRKRGQTCSQDRNCCRRGGQRLTCQDGRCQGPPAVRCGPDGPCRVFVSSSLQDGDLGGLDGADARCQGLADEAGLPGIYRAWLSDATGSPTTRFTNTDATGPYVLVDAAATEIAADWTALTDGTLAAPINLNETGVSVTAFVWTGTAASGVAAGGDAHCANWTDGSTSGWSVPIGRTVQTDSGWTNYSSVNNCAFQGRLYCFQQG